MNIYTKKNTKNGFISTVLLVIIGLILLKFIFKFDLIAYLTSPGPQKIITTIWGWIQNIYIWINLHLISLFSK